MNDHPRDNSANSRDEWTIRTIKELMDERFRIVEERITREATQQKAEVAAALAAQKEQTRDAFLSSEKAIVKAEAAQNAHNVLANGLQTRLDQQAREFIARPEFDQRFGQVEGKIAELRETRSGTTGERRGSKDTSESVRWGVQILITLAALAAGHFVFK